MFSFSFVVYFLAVSEGCDRGMKFVLGIKKNDVQEAKANAVIVRRRDSIILFSFYVSRNSIAGICLLKACALYIVHLHIHHVRTSL